MSYQRRGGWDTHGLPGKAKSKENGFSFKQQIEDFGLINFTNSVKNRFYNIQDGKE
jgi:isoleucyl-tRNA synthetase